MLYENPPNKFISLYWINKIARCTKKKRTLMSSIIWIPLTISDTSIVSAKFLEGQTVQLEDGTTAFIQASIPKAAENLQVSQVFAHMEILVIHHWSQHAEKDIWNHYTWKIVNCMYKNFPRLISTSQVHIKHPSPLTLACRSMFHWMCTCRLFS